MAAGHNNVAAVGTSASNAHYGTNFLGSYRQGISHAQVAVLKDNLRAYRGAAPTCLWSEAASLAGNTSPIFDADTEANLMVFQRNEHLTVDGIYGAASRNAMHRVIGISPKGWVRISNSMPGSMNYNDTPAGLSSDASYKLDHSWATSRTRDTMYSLGHDFYREYSKAIELNDASLIDGADTPEHVGHRNGRVIDIRNSGMTAGQEAKFLELCAAHPNVARVLFHTKHGRSSTKLAYAPGHNDHFHVETSS